MTVEKSNAVRLGLQYRLRQAALNDRADLLAQLLEQGADPNAPDDEGCTALHYAVRLQPHLPDKSHLRLVQQLLAAGARPEPATAGRRTPLFEAAANGLYRVVELLHLHGAAVLPQQPDGWTALHLLAAKFRHRPEGFELARLEQGRLRRITQADQVRQTLGYHPDDRFQQYLQTFQLLLSLGADPNLRKREEQQTPLFDAVLSRATPMVKALLEAGAAPNVQDKWGAAPLHYAAESGHCTEVATLLAHGADLNLRQTAGFTPLMLAALCGATDCVHYLLQRGAEVHHRSTHRWEGVPPGSSAADIARLRNHPAVTALCNDGAA